MSLSNPSVVRSLTVSRAQYGPYSATLQFNVNFNKAPGQVVLIDPEEDGICTELRPIFKWRIPVDPENKPLHFQIQIDTTNTFDSRPGDTPEFTYDSCMSYNGFLDFGGEPKPSGIGQASFQIPVELMLRTVYYWRVRAYDGALSDPIGYIARYGQWSVARKLTIGIIATRVLLAASRTYLPLQGQASDITASLVDRLGNVDVAMPDASASSFHVVLNILFT